MSNQPNPTEESNTINQEVTNATPQQEGNIENQEVTHAEETNETSPVIDTEKTDETPIVATEVVAEETKEAEESAKKTPLLDRLVKRLYEENGEKKEEFKKVRDIISPNPMDGDVWETPDGKTVISHPGIEKLADYVGAEWVEEILDDTPNSNNDKGYYFRMYCRFPDGSIGKNVGSANDKNAKGDISNAQKYEMAFKRAQDRSFLNSRYMKMFDVYSAGESDSWSKEEMLKHQILQKDKQIKHIIADGKAKISHLDQEVGRRNRFIDKLLSYIALPKDDPQFPKVYIQTLIESGEKDYLKELLNHEDKMIAYTVKRLLSLNNLSLEEKEAMDQQEADEQEADKQEAPNAVSEEGTEETSEQADAADVSSSTAEDVNTPTDDEVAATIQPIPNQSKPFVLEPIEEEEFERMNFRLGKEEDK